MTVRDHNPHSRRLHLPLVAGPAADIGRERKPSWLRVEVRTGPNFEDIKRTIRNGRLHTVCEEASCPNIWECWEDREATFLILGDRCTRRCGFCDVMTARPRAVDDGEPARVAASAAAMDLNFVVITGVARDDLPLGGAASWAVCVRALRRAVPNCGVELLPPDFSGEGAALEVIMEAAPDVFAHNLETVRRLHGRMRPAFDYDRSLAVLCMAKCLRPGQITKSNLILGMGETREEVRESLRDLLEAGCEIVTLGQYLQPTRHHAPVDRWVTPEEFAEHKAAGEAIGLAHVEAGPLVRSSYHAGRQFSAARAAMVGGAGL